MILMIWYNLYYIDIDKSCRLVKGLRIHICNHSKTSLCVGDQKWQLSFCQILESKGLVKITCVLAVIYWYCRVKHGHLQDFRLACYRYKCPGGPFLFDFGWVLPLFVPRKRRRLSCVFSRNLLEFWIFPLFKCWKHPQGISLYFPFVASVDWTSSDWNWRIEFFLGAKKVALSVDCRRWLHWHCM